jgi:hypothetical protein
MVLPNSTADGGGDWLVGFQPFINGGIDFLLICVHKYVV